MYCFSVNTVCCFLCFSTSTLEPSKLFIYVKAADKYD